VGIILIPGDRRFERAWSKARHGEKRIWVDFERDVVFIWSASEQLEEFACYVPEEAGKIRQLRIGGVWVTPHQPGAGPGPYTTAPPPQQVKLLKSAVMRGIGLFGGLKELFVWPEQGWGGAPVSGAGAEMVKGDIMEVLRREKEKLPKRTGELLGLL
jgi:hypothetical protein